MPRRRILIALGSAFFLVVLVRTAWLSELSYLTLRTVEHAASGHGLRWNVSERVQVFDHPLWMLLLLAGRGLFGESYYTTFALSLVLSTATVALVLRSAARDEAVVLGGALLSLSWAFVTYSTSGLEGPLAHLLVALFCLAWFTFADRPARVTRAAVLAGLAGLAQPATLLLTLPPLAASAMSGGDGRPDRLRPATAVRRSNAKAEGRRHLDHGWPEGRRHRDLLLACGPPLAWGVFASFYYGTPFPTPVIAEWTEHAGLSARFAALGQLAAYILRQDPLAPAVIVAGATMAWQAARAERPLVIGALAYVVTLAAWAGDGMPGRWLALPFLVSTVLVLRHLPLARPRVLGAAAAAVLLLAAVPARPTMRSDVRFGTDAQQADAGDPRGADYPATGLLHDVRQWYPPTHPEARRGGVAWQDTNRVKSSPHPAYFGFAAGYGVHVIDPKGRTDPLLARLRPSQAQSPGTGGARPIPAGYEASLPDKVIAIEDPAVAAYYDRVRFVTRGPLSSPSRLFAALRLAFTSPPELQLHVPTAAARTEETVTRSRRAPASSFGHRASSLSGARASRSQPDAKEPGS